MKFHIDIQRSRETVFEHIRDLAGYKAWLPASRLYVATTEISQHPVTVGTTYVDKGPTTTMQGRVTEMEPPRIIVFQESQHLKRGFLNAELTVTIRYSLEEHASSGTLVNREATVQTTGLLSMLRPVLLASIRKENQRILRCMKEYLEARVS